MHGDVVHTVADFGVRVREFQLGVQPLVDRLPGLAAVIGAEGARRRDGDEDALGSLGSRTMVCRHMPPAPGCHRWPLAARRPASSCQVWPPSLRAKQGGIFHAGVDRSASVSEVRGARRA